MPPLQKRDEGLSGVAKIVIVVLVVCLGLWGCARKPDNRAGSNERVRVLESRCQKLEQDYRSVAQARDKARKDIAALEEETQRLQKELAEKANLAKECSQMRDQLKAGQIEREEMSKLLSQRTSERDDLRMQVVQRMTERDLLQNRVEIFRKNLQQLLTQDDNPAPPMQGISPPAGAVSAGPTLGSD